MNKITFVSRKSSPTDTLKAVLLDGVQIGEVWKIQTAYAHQAPWGASNGEFYFTRSEAVEALVSTN